MWLRTRIRSTHFCGQSDLETFVCSFFFIKSTSFVFRLLDFSEFCREPSLLVDLGELVELLVGDDLRVFIIFEVLHCLCLLLFEGGAERLIQKVDWRKSEIILPTKLASMTDCDATARHVQGYIACRRLKRLPVVWLLLAGWLSVCRDETSQPSVAHGLYISALKSDYRAFYWDDEKTARSAVWLNHFRSCTQRTLFGAIYKRDQI